MCGNEREGSESADSFVELLRCEWSRRQDLDGLGGRGHGRGREGHSVMMVCGASVSVCVCVCGRRPDGVGGG